MARAAHERNGKEVAPNKDAIATLANSQRPWWRCSWDDISPWRHQQMNTYEYRFLLRTVGRPPAIGVLLMVLPRRLLALNF
jgi:hypothetical protein